MQSTHSAEPEYKSSRHVRQLVLHATGAAYVAGPICPAACLPCFAHEPAAGNGRELLALSARDSAAGSPAEFCIRSGAVIHRPVANGAAEKNRSGDQRCAAIARERAAWPSISCL